MALKIVCTLCGAEAPLDVCPDCSVPEKNNPEFTSQETLRVINNPVSFAKQILKSQGVSELQSFIQGLTTVLYSESK